MLTKAFFLIMTNLEKLFNANTVYIKQIDDNHIVIYDGVGSCEDIAIADINLFSGKLTNYARVHIGVSTEHCEDWQIKIQNEDDLIITQRIDELSEYVIEDTNIYEDVSVKLIVYHKNHNPILFEIMFDQYALFFPLLFE
jgi:hypothetical protein